MLLDSVFPRSSHDSRAGEGSAPSKHHMLIIAGTDKHFTPLGWCVQTHPLLQPRGCCTSAVSEMALPSNSHCKVLQKGLPLRDSALMHTRMKAITESYHLIQLVLPIDQTYPTDQRRSVLKETTVHNLDGPPMPQLPWNSMRSSQTRKP